MYSASHLCHEQKSWQKLKTIKYDLYDDIMWCMAKINILKFEIKFDKIIWQGLSFYVQVWICGNWPKNILGKMYT